MYPLLEHVAGGRTRIVSRGYKKGKLPISPTAARGVRWLDNLLRQPWNVTTLSFDIVEQKMDIQRCID